MRHQNSVFHELLKHIPWDVFDRLVGEHGANSRVRRLDTKSQFVALLYGQLSGAASLREIVTGLASHAARLYHLGVRPVQRSTLADANAGRPSAVFAELFAELVKRAHRGLRRALGESVYLIDSTGLRLSEASAAWARFSSGVCGAKVHVIYDPDADHPIYAVVTAAKVNDITAAQEMPIEAGATYVFDLGYYDYRWWAKLDAAGCRIVTRFKSNTPLRGARDCAVAADSSVLSDRVGHLPARQVIFTTSLPPALAAGALAAIRHLKHEPEGARTPPGACGDRQAAACRRRSAGDAVTKPYRSGTGRRRSALQGNFRCPVAAASHLCAADQLSDGAARHRAVAADTLAAAQRRRYRCAGRGALIDVWQGEPLSQAA